MKNKKNVSFHSLFWVVYMLALLGSFEMAYQSPSHPIWSGTFGFPIPHHYLLGFMGVAILWLWAFKDEYIAVAEKAIVKTVKVTKALLFPDNGSK